ncbi:ThiJ/PfpI family protein [Cristinia sonorae]|uniref:D-lactate dehydratase n=1 Tax=Cristinia sonorae TaxID=1940300 RepID=A0A8K0XRR5_9AGAR|nr:ThiJ/PfpI family protein [Cristinia sonorae]
MVAGKILIILSDAHSFEVHKSDDTTSQEESGFFLSELAKPLIKLLDAQYAVTFASPNGKGPNIDPLSESTMLAFLGNWWQKNKENKLIDEMRLTNNLASPRPFASISNAELNTFDGVFIPGGHAPLTDLGNNPELGRILLHFHNQKKPTALICHGPYALLSTKYAPESPGFAYKGYNLTSWSDAEESLVETLKGGTIDKVESTLRGEGAVMITGTGQKLGSITVDREVVSGANPLAADALGTQFVEMLKGTQ